MSGMQGMVCITKCNIHAMLVPLFFPPKGWLFFYLLVQFGFRDDVPPEGGKFYNWNAMGSSSFLMQAKLKCYSFHCLCNNRFLWGALDL